MTQHPLKCHRCEKPIADAPEESAAYAAIAAAETDLEEAKLKEEFAKKYCVCRPLPSSEFTSSSQPLNLDDIEKRLK